MDKKQLDLAKIAAEKNKLKAEYFESLLSTRLFPSGKLSELWKEVTSYALVRTSPVSHGISLKKFAEVLHSVNKKEPITLFVFGILSNSLDLISPSIFSISIEDYVLIINESVSHIEFYSETVKQIREEVDLKIEKEYKLKMAADSSNHLKAEA
jgi:hypothetical protein